MEAYISQAHIAVELLEAAEQLALVDDHVTLALE